MIHYQFISSILDQSELSTVQKNELEENCENCGDSFPTSSILKHIAKTKVCKSFYGTRFEDMKKERRDRRNEKHRDAMQVLRRNTEFKENELRKEREKYAKDSGSKLKNRKDAYSKNPDKQRERKRKSYAKHPETKRKQSRQNNSDR